MRLSTRARHAVRLMVAVCRNSAKNKPTQLNEIAARTGISVGYLEQIALFLKSAGLLNGVCGRKGGYLLARPPEEISLADVVEAAIGPIALSDCVKNPQMCIRSETCECRALWAVIGARIRAMLDDFSPADLCDLQCQEGILEEARKAGMRPAGSMIPNDSNRRRQ